MYMNKLGLHSNIIIRGIALSAPTILIGRIVHAALAQLLKFKILYSVQRL